MKMLKRLASLRVGRTHARNAVDDEGAEIAAEREIIGGAERVAAQLVETEPGDALGGARHGDGAALDRERGAARRAVVGEIAEGALRARDRRLSSAGVK